MVVLAPVLGGYGRVGVGGGHGRDLDVALDGVDDRLTIYVGLHPVGEQLLRVKGVESAEIRDLLHHMLEDVRILRMVGGDRLLQNVDHLRLHLGNQIDVS